MLEREKSKRRISHVMKHVEKLYQEEPDLVNSDTQLIVRYARKYHNLRNLDELVEDKTFPALETITRCARKLRATGKYDSKVEVENVRRETEGAFVDYFGNR